MEEEIIENFEGDIIENFTLLKKTFYFEKTNSEIWLCTLNGTNLNFSIVITNNKISDINLVIDQKIEIKNKNYKLLNKVGEGTFGLVYNLEDKQTQEKFVLKVHITPNEALREYNIYKMLDGCSSIPKIFSGAEDAENNILLMQKLDNELLKKNLSIFDILNITKDILTSLKFIHKKYIVHGDVKISNILLDNNNVAYLCDFTNSYRRYKIVDEIGTIWFRSPENCDPLMENKYIIDFPADIWGLGITFLALLNNKKTPNLFACNDSIRLYTNIKVQENVDIVIESVLRKYELYSEYNLLIDLAKNLLKVDPNRRITAKNALKTFFNTNN